MDKNFKFTNKWRRRREERGVRKGGNDMKHTNSAGDKTKGKMRDYTKNENSGNKGKGGKGGKNSWNR